MTMAEVSIQKELVKKLKSNTEPKEGLIYGMKHNNAVYFIGAAFDTPDMDAVEAINMLPYNFEELAQLTIINGEANELTLKSRLNFVVRYQVNSSTLEIFKRIDGRFKAVEFDVITDNPFEKLFLTIKVKSNFDIRICDVTLIPNDLANLQKRVMSSELIFKCSKDDNYNDGDDIYSEGDVSTGIIIGDFCKSGEKENEVTLNVLGAKAFDESDLVNAKQAVHFITDHFTKTKESSMIMTVSSESYAICLRSLTISEVALVAKQAIVRFLSLYIDSLNRYITEDFLKIALRPYHFKPDPLGHFLTIFFREEDNNNADERKKLHALFDLPLTKPIFTKGCSLNMNTLNTIPIVNVHMNLPSSGVSEGREVIIRGTYIYFHYAQDNVKDSGWGCAYRSLQTIFSWYLMQGYSELCIPDHLTIQKCLYRLKDKPKSFIGSNQWIGSSEISYCLSDMLNVDCEIVHISSRDELVTIGSKLEAHFKINDTPVMIGGGQLAHTIIGVHFNKETGDIRFLVLDPHYVGNDDLVSIQSKGGVAWRPITFWDKNSFFNLCLPKRPKLLY